VIVVQQRGGGAGCRGSINQLTSKGEETLVKLFMIETIHRRRTWYARVGPIYGLWPTKPWSKKQEGGRGKGF